MRKSLNENHDLASPRFGKNRDRIPLFFRPPRKRMRGRGSPAIGASCAKVCVKITTWTTPTFGKNRDRTPLFFRPPRKRVRGAALRALSELVRETLDEIHDLVPLRPWEKSRPHTPFFFHHARECGSAAHVRYRNLVRKSLNEIHNLGNPSDLGKRNRIPLFRPPRKRMRRRGSPSFIGA